MAAQRCDAVVLRRTRFSESSLVVVLLSRELGRVEALARGCRRAKSPMRGHLDLFNREEVMIYERTRGSLDLLTESYVMQEFVGLRRDACRFAAACVWGEMLASSCMLRDPHPGAFDALQHGLQQLDAEQPLGPVAGQVLLALLRDLGFYPRLDRCAGCESELPDNAGLSLSGLRGGLVCEACAARAGGSELSARHVSLLRYLARGNGSQPSRLAVCEGEWLAVVQGLCRYTEDMMGRRLRSKEVLFGLWPHGRQAGGHGRGTSPRGDG